MVASNIASAQRGVAWHNLYMDEKQPITTEEIPKNGFWRKQFTTVTPFSKALAAFLFVALPCVGFGLGYYSSLEKNGGVEREVEVEFLDQKEIVEEVISASEASIPESSKEIAIGYEVFFDTRLGYWRVFTPSDSEMGYKFMTEVDARRFTQEDETGVISVTTRTYTDEELGFSIDYPGQWFIHTQDFLDSKDIIVRFGNARVEYSSGVNVVDITDWVLSKLSSKPVTIENIKEVYDYEYLYSAHAQLMGVQNEYSSSLFDLGGFQALVIDGEPDALGGGFVGSVIVILQNGTVARITFNKKDITKEVALSLRRAI